MRPNRLRDLWRQNKAATNCWLSLGNAYVAELIAHQGWDSVTIDLQHAPADYKDALAMLTAVSTTDCVPIVRVPWNDPGDIMRVLDAGAYGVMCPTIETAEQAMRFVGAARYAPAGYRSVGPNRALLYGGADYIARANDTVLTIAQIETAGGLENVDAIARVPGLDMLLVGPSDLGLSMGRSAQPDQTDPVIVEAIDRILQAAHGAKIKAGIFCADADYAQKMKGKGFDLVTVTSDIGMIGTGNALARRFQ